MKDAYRTIILSCPCVFKTRHLVHKKATESLRQRCEKEKKRPLSCLYHTLLKSLRVACTLNIIIRPYLNFNAEQMKGVGIGFGYFYFGVDQGWNWDR